MLLVDNKVCISIYGVCVLRDCFAFMDTESKCIIDRYIQQVNPISAIDTSPLLKPWDSDVINLYDVYMSEGIRNFHKKCITLDMNKNVWSYLQENKSDWFIFDVGELRKNVIKFYNGSITYI